MVEPGPALDPHLDTVAAVVAARGGAEGIALTHDHEDHAEGLDGLRVRVGAGVPVVTARAGAADGDTFGPLRVARAARATPTTTWPSSPSGRR